MKLVLRTFRYNPRGVAQTQKAQSPCPQYRMQRSAARRLWKLGGLIAATIVVCSSCSIALRGIAVRTSVGAGAARIVGSRAALAPAGFTPRMSLSRTATARAATAWTLERAAVVATAVTATAEGALLQGSTRLGSWRTNGELYLRDSHGAEVLAGRIHNGLIWAPDGGGNLVPVARLRGLANRAGINVKNRPNGTTIVELKRDASFDVLRLRDGFFEVRLKSGRSGWLPAEVVALMVVSALPDSTHASLLEVGIKACARFDSVERIDLFAARDGAPEAMPPESADAKKSNSDWVQLLASKQVHIRFSPEKKDVARRLAATLVHWDMMVKAESVDSTITKLCGGEIFYNYRDLDAARVLQTISAPLLTLRATSHDITQPMMIWVK